MSFAYPPNPFDLLQNPAKPAVWVEVLGQWVDGCHLFVVRDSGGWRVDARYWALGQVGPDPERRYQRRIQKVVARRASWDEALAWAVAGP